MKIQKIAARVMALFLVLMLVITLASQVFVYASAVELTDVERLKSQQSELQGQQSEYQSELDRLAQEEESAVAKYRVLSEQNQVIANEIDTCTALIEEYDGQIETASEALDEAQKKREDYYELYCDRISQMEQGGNISIWDAIFSSRSLTELLTVIYDMNSIIHYDSDVLDQLEALENNILEKKEELKAAKSEQEAMLDSLKEKKEQLEANEASASDVLAEIQNNIEFYQGQLSAVTVECSELEDDILDAETEAAKRAAQEAAEAERAEEEDHANRSTPRVPEADSDVEEDTSSDSETTAASEPEEEPEEEPVQEEEPEEEEQPDEKPVSSSGVTGDDVVAYAVQFIGNPYVWGGTSLTQGCDCSGFVMSVYGHFGYTLPHFSGSLRYCGIGVDYASAIPGDIICYDGHVGIYMGGGQMVNAFDTDHGIIICSVNTSKLIAVRRIIY